MESLVKLLGPSTRWSRKQIAHSCHLSPYNWTCVTVLQKYGPRAERWWAKKIKQYLKTQGLSTDSVVPFTSLARVKAWPTKHRPGEEALERAKFLEWIRQNYD